MNKEQIGIESVKASPFLPGDTVRRLWGTKAEASRVVDECQQIGKFWNVKLMGDNVWHASELWYRLH